MTSADVGPINRAPLPCDRNGVALIPIDWAWRRIGAENRELMLAFIDANALGQSLERRAWHRLPPNVRARLHRLIVSFAEDEREGAPVVHIQAESKELIS